MTLEAFFEHEKRDDLRKPECAERPFAARDDVVLLLSNSGETDELVSLLPHLKRQGAQLIALTGNEHSSLAQAANIHLDASVDAEACPLGLAPTASTTAALALGDALAVALLLLALAVLLARNVAANLEARQIKSGFDFLRDRAVFSVFRRASEVPIYRIEKDPRLARKQGIYSVISASGLILRRGHELDRVLLVIDRKLAVV